MRPLLASALALFALAAPSTAAAYSLNWETFGPVQWTTGTLYPDMVPATLSASDIAGIEAAADLWTDSMAGVELNPVRGDNGFGVGNFDSEIARVCNDLLTNGRAGVAWPRWLAGSGWIVEADIFINDCHATDTVEHVTAKGDQIAYGGTTRPLVPLMLHEFGHSIGLGHEDEVYNLMGHEYSFVTANGSSHTWSVGADAGLGAVVLYGFSSHFDDASLSHHRFQEAAGAYSRHMRTQVLDPLDRPRPEETTAKEPRYKVWPGGEIQVEFTLEGNGKTGGMATLDLYLSIDDTISTADTLLDSTLISVAPGMVYTSAYPVTLPSGLSPGNYSVGGILTPHFPDDVSSNNATYTHIEVVHASEPCTASSPCGHREGDCDTNADCTDGTTCVHNVGADFGASSLTDICLLPLWDRCTPDLPCASGEGDCDSGADCLSGVCQHDVGLDYGYTSASLDVCE